MSPVLHVSQATFARDVLQSSVPVLVDFYADWCGPCRMLAPTLDNIAAEFDGQAKVVKVNIDNDPALADQFSVSSIPTLLLLVGGKVVGRQVGLPRQGSLRDALKQVVK